MIPDTRNRSHPDMAGETRGPPDPDRGIGRLRVVINCRAEGWDEPDDSSLGSQPTIPRRSLSLRADQL